jgi:protein-tyrosine phosphatase
MTASGRMPLDVVVRLARKAWLRLECTRAMIRARKDSRARLAAKSPKRVLVLCYGNIYRSAFVSVSLAARLQSQVSGCEIRCAGFHPVEGRYSPDDFVVLAREYGVELAGHRSRLVSSEDIAWADTIVIMDRFNWGRVAAHGKDARAKIVWLGAFAPTFPLQVRDPYKQPPPRVRAIVEQMKTATESLAAELSR